MNHVRIDSSHIIRFIRNSGVLLLSLFACLLPVSALTIGDYNNSYGNNVTGLISFFGLGEASSTRSGSLVNNYYWRYRVVSSSSSLYSPTLTDGNSSLVSVSGFYCTGYSIFFYDSSEFPSVYVYLCIDRSSDGVVWSQVFGRELDSVYQYNEGGSVGVPLKYIQVPTSSGNNLSARNSISYSDTGSFPVIQSSPTSVLGVISKNSSYWPWNGTNSNGGRHWSDNTDLDGENTSKYSQVFIVMDSNDDNSVTEEEVNYYNYNYNTSYDYSVFNESQNFNQDQFLYWIAKQIEVGVENPGGGTGSGGGDSSLGGITVTDSFTQTQTQTIEENAVNVTVNNNNALTQENYQELNSLINNYNGSSQDETDPFQQAIGNFQAFHAIALAFAGLASIVFGWLPWWVTALLGAMFSMICVFIVLRLIHLFK